VAEPSVAIVTGLSAGEGELTAGEFFAAFAQASEEVELGALPVGEAFDLLFEDDPLP
jgi:hypothetical protein